MVDFAGRQRVRFPRRYSFGQAWRGEGCTHCKYCSIESQPGRPIRRTILGDPRCLLNPICVLRCAIRASGMPYYLWITRSSAIPAIVAKTGNWAFLQRSRSISEQRCDGEPAGSVRTSRPAALAFGTRRERERRALQCRRGPIRRHRSHLTLSLRSRLIRAVTCEVLRRDVAMLGAAMGCIV